MFKCRHHVVQRHSHVLWVPNHKNNSYFLVNNISWHSEINSFKYNKQCITWPRTAAQLQSWHGQIHKLASFSRHIGSVGTTGRGYQINCMDIVSIVYNRMDSGTSLNFVDVLHEHVLIEITEYHIGDCVSIFVYVLQ